MKLIMNSEIYNNSVEYGNKMAEAIIQWSKQDLYAETKTKPKYLIRDLESTWQPTPDEFRSALEPYWGTISTFVLKDLDEYNCDLQIKFSTDTASQFYKKCESSIY